MQLVGLVVTFYNVLIFDAEVQFLVAFITKLAVRVDLASLFIKFDFLVGQNFSLDVMVYGGAVEVDLGKPNLKVLTSLVNTGVVSPGLLEADFWPHVTLGHPNVDASVTMVFTLRISVAALGLDP